MQIHRSRSAGANTDSYEKNGKKRKEIILVFFEVVEEGKKKKKTNRKKTKERKTQMYVTADYKFLGYCFLIHIVVSLCACTVELFITNWKQLTNERTNKTKIVIRNIKSRQTRR